jgi:hypothetical protein
MGTKILKVYNSRFPNTVSLQTLPYLGINLTEHGQNLHSENHKMLMSEVQ